VTVLDQVPAGLGSWVDRADALLPRTFSEVAVFIDTVTHESLLPNE
jgi:hypothetical protein